MSDEKFENFFDEVMESGEIWSIIAKIGRIAEKTKIILGSFFLRT